MTTPPKQLVLRLERCSLDGAIEVARKYTGKIWGFSVYDLSLMEGFNAVYQLRKYGKVYSDLKIDDQPKTIDYMLQCAWAAGADIVSIKSDSESFSHKIAGYPSCKKVYEHSVQENLLLSKENQRLQLIGLPELMLYFQEDTSKI